MSEKTKKGYNAGIALIVIAVVIAANVLFARLPETVKQQDITKENLYDLSAISLDTLNTLDKDIDITIVASEQKDDYRIDKMVAKYADTSDRIHVKKVVANEDPALVDELGGEEEVLIVGCEETGKERSVPYSDMIMLDMQRYYSTGEEIEKWFDAEGQITSAINYVTNESTAQIYLTRARGEQLLPDTVFTMLRKASIAYERIKLEEDGIPDDCELLILNGRQHDFDETEMAMIMDYVRNGGNIFVIMYCTLDDMPNMASLLDYFGLTLEDGYVADYKKYYQDNYYTIYPITSGEHEITADIDTEPLLMNARGLTKKDGTDAKVDIFMISSDNAAVVTGESKKEGRYIVGATSKKSNNGGQLAVVTSDFFIDKSMNDAFTNLPNYDIFMNAVTYFLPDVENVAVAPKSLQVQYNNSSSSRFYSLPFVFAVPIVIMAIGFVVWLRRRKL